MTFVWSVSYQRNNGSIGSTTITESMGSETHARSIFKSKYPNCFIRSISMSSPRS